MSDTKYTYTLTIEDDGESGVQINSGFTPDIPADFKQEDMTAALYLGIDVADHIRSVVTEMSDEPEA